MFLIFTYDRICLGGEGFDYDVFIEEVENPTGTRPVFKPKINAYVDVQR